MSETNDPGLYFAEDGQPRSERFGDIYYSLEDGLSETRAVFLKGCHMPDIWAERRRFVVGELGFGTGLNICALMALWAEHRPRDGYLHIFSVEGFLMQAHEARQALSAWPELAEYVDALLAQWPFNRRGFHHMSFPQWGVSFTLALMEVRDALDGWDGKADAWFLDGFSPALNPDMWAEDVLQRIGAHTAVGGRVATFTVAGSVRRGLEAAGFAPRKVPGFGKKREQLEAIYTAEANGVFENVMPQRVAIIGAGIAGVSVVRALAEKGIDADLFDAHGLGGGASGNRAGLMTPRLDAGGGTISQLFADGFYYAYGLYNRLCPEAIISQGVQQIPSGPRDSGRFQKIAQQAGFAADDMSADANGLLMHKALAIEPLRVLEALKGPQAVVTDRIVRMERQEDGWRLYGEGGTYDGYDQIFITCGDGLFDLKAILADELDLRPVRGQIEVAQSSQRSSQAAAWGGYYVPVPEGFVFGSTHIRGDRGAEVRVEDRTRNLETLSQARTDEAASVVSEELHSRASIRMTTRDHLPVMGEVENGVFVLTGLGARGFCLGPLLGQALVAQALGFPSPLSHSMQAILSHKRFLPALSEVAIA
ncbi:MAG: tRNA (5-methylaminomethyl-2-thiouridine)(34)-methyltransferase MnmD [Asticcacaulis sp.]